MHDTNALFDNLLAAYRNADDPDRFLREFLMRLDDATSNAVAATERKLERLDAGDDLELGGGDDLELGGGDDLEPDRGGDLERDDEQDVEQAETPLAPKK